MTRAQAVAYADAVNLNAGDLSPGWLAEQPAGVFKPTPAIVAAARCAGAVEPRDWVLYSHSPTYEEEQERDGGWLHSTVLVFQTTEASSRNAAASESARGLECSSRAEQAHTSPRTVVGTRAVFKSLSRLPDPLPGVEGAVAWRTTLTEYMRAYPSNVLPGHEVPARTVTVYEDWLVAGAGPAEIELVAVRPGEPMNTTTEDDALSTIYARAEQHLL